MELIDLKKGRRYWVKHKRKGEFQAVVVGFVNAEPDDPQDKFFVTMDINTADDGAPWLRRVKRANVTQTNIRPSLITHIEPYQPRPQPAPPAKVAKKESLTDRLKRVFGFRR